MSFVLLSWGVLCFFFAAQRLPDKWRQGPDITCFDPQLHHTQVVRLQDCQFQNTKPDEARIRRLVFREWSAAWARHARMNGNVRVFASPLRIFCASASASFCSKQLNGRNQLFRVRRVLGQVVSCHGVRGMHCERNDFRHRDRKNKASTKNSPNEDAWWSCRVMSPSVVPRRASASSHPKRRA